MSERFGVAERVPFNIEERLGRQELNQLEGVIRDEIEIRDDTLADLQQQNLTIRTERNALLERVETVERERLDLQERVDQLETDRLRFDPETVVADFGGALDAVAEQRRYAVSDFHVNLRANVISTDDGVRLQLPTPLEDVDARNLSTLTFGLSRQSGTETADYREVPALEGLQRDTAEEHLAERGLGVGEITLEAADEASVVLGQFPEAYVLAEPDSEVDLTVSVAPEPDEPDEPESDEPMDRSETDEPSAEDELRVIDGIGPRRAERLRAERVTGLRALLETDPERLADVTGVSTGQAESWLVQARELR